jgi:predicted signal transduction protein with EAL and GGDEF domain
MERNEFEVYYQPQIDIRTNRIIGMEALPPMAASERGLLSPVGKPGAVAEERGFIVLIGDCAAHRAQSGAFRDPFPISGGRISRRAVPRAVAGRRDRRCHQAGASRSAVPGAEITRASRWKTWI